MHNPFTRHNHLHTTIYITTIYTSQLSEFHVPSSMQKLWVAHLVSDHEVHQRGEQGGEEKLKGQRGDAFCHKVCRKVVQAIGELPV
jgi:hypothetical protein